SALRNFTRFRNRRGKSLRAPCGRAGSPAETWSARHWRGLGRNANRAEAKCREYPRMTEAFICDAIRTPVGRYNGGLAAMRVDDLAAHPIKALMQRNANVDWGAVDDVIYGCVIQAGEDNRNVGRMAGLLAGLPVEVAGATVNRLCGSGLEAAGHAARA